MIFFYELIIEMFEDITDLRTWHDCLPKGQKCVINQVIYDILRETGNNS